MVDPIQHKPVAHDGAIGVPVAPPAPAGRTAPVDSTVPDAGQAVPANPAAIPAVMPPIPGVVTPGMMARISTPDAPIGPAGPNQVGPSQVGPSQTASTSSNPIGSNVGAGVTGFTSGQVPPATLSSFFAFMRSVDAMTPHLPNGPELVMEALQKMYEGAETINRQAVERNFDARSTATGEELRQSLIAQGKLDEAHDHSFWDDLASAVSAINSVVSPALDLGLIAGAIFFGGPFTVLLIGAIPSLVGDADSVTKKISGHGIAGEFYLMKHPGDNEGAAQADRIFMGLVVLGALAMAYFNPGGAAEQSTQDAGKFYKAIAALKGAANTTKRVGAVVTAVSTIGEGVVTYQRTGLEADAKEAQANAKRFQATNEQLAQISNDDLDHAAQVAKTFLQEIEDLSKIYLQQGEAALNTRFTA